MLISFHCFKILMIQIVCLILLNCRSRLGCQICAREDFAGMKVSLSCCCSQLKKRRRKITCDKLCGLILRNLLMYGGLSRNRFKSQMTVFNFFHKIFLGHYVEMQRFRWYSNSSFFPMQARRMIC